MKTTHFLFTVAIISVLGTLPAGFAQDSSTAPRSGNDKSDRLQVNRPSAHPRKVSEQELKKKVTKVNKASSFIGMSVKNLKNENLGKVEDLAFDSESGKISYAVLSVGGFLGMNEKYIAVPLDALTPAPGEDHLVLDADKDRLQQVPGFAKNAWPDLDTPAWGAAAGFTSGTGRSTGSAARLRTTETADSTPQRFSGSVTQFDQASRSLTVKGESGEQNFTLDPVAQIKAGDKSDAKLADIRVGSNVTVEYTREGNQQIAKSVQTSGSSANEAKE